MVARPLIGLFLVAVLADAQKGSSIRCRDRDPQCASWAGRGECGKNHNFMAETCPQACDYCDNAGLFPTPSHFQLDLVCKDRLAINAGTYKGAPTNDLPDGCEFRCRDNMTAAICNAAALEGKCEDKKLSKIMRFQCPESCGVCKALEMANKKPAFPKPACRLPEGNAPEHAGQCESWANSGECVTNFGFMSLNCEAACGLCEIDGVKPETPAKINAPPAAPRKPKAGKKKKKKKARVDTVADVNRDDESTSGGEALGGDEAAGGGEPETKTVAETAAAEPAATKEEAPADDKKSKRGWAARAKEAAKAAFSSKKSLASPKDET